ncbi:glycosyltransferase family 25 protein [Endozoicomonas sp. G2_1]|uniref:glycosyltransferase family 25 protein n=1 Tax=Endozoicomonas sp. G2_1 TaxID=2821091 RepID=UPI001ADCA756|nr:glycosyltransferase family 25 protein [Endozoicomonas sp. G2_1]MBO9489221.1 glycosyltransferase family 25 protein [Endozoicomonas sp. G2_1]
MTVNYKTFLINLDKSTDRLAYSEKRLTEHNIAFERVAAVYGADLSRQELTQAYSDQLPNAYYKKLNIGEIGCYLSHRKVWQKIVDDKLDFAVVLEDDFNIVDDFSAMLAAVSSAPITWDYIKLAEHDRPRKSLHTIDINNHKLITYDKIPARTCAQVVSYEGAKKLLAASQPFSRPVDIDLQYWWEKDIRVFGLMPYVFRPKTDSVSEIDKLKGRDDAEKNDLRRLISQVKFFAHNKFASKALVKALKFEVSKL